MSSTGATGHVGAVDVVGPIGAGRRSGILLVCLATLVTLSACGKGKTPLQPDPTDPPTIACDASVSLQVAAAPVTVDYAAPVVTGGAAPLAVSCTAPSGGTFPLGTTDVVCSATDAQQRRAQCVFQITVAIAPRLQGTRFLAFGDSITEGEVSAPATVPRALETQNSYPTVLQGLLRDRYVGQTNEITVFNRGKGGETAGMGEDRLVDEIRALNPDAVLLLEGANDVTSAMNAAEVIGSSLRADINRAYRLGVKKVFISTLLPQVVGRQKAGDIDLLDAINVQIHYVAGLEGAIVVDAFQAFDPQKELLIGIDGLHPTAEGYRRLAELFFDAIRANFEMPEDTTAPAGLFRRPGRRH